MNLSIFQYVNIVVSHENEEFLFVEREVKYKVFSRFIKNGKIVCQTSLITYFLQQQVEILDFAFEKAIYLQRRNFLYYSLFYGNDKFDVKQQLFKSPRIILRLNDCNIGFIESASKFNIEHRAFKMKTETEDHLTNTMFLILFLSQLRSF